MSVLESTPRKKISVLTYGCRANQYDSGALEHLLNNNFEVVHPDTTSDIVVLNSCAITEQAEMEARQMIRKIKRKNPATRIVVTGCSAQVSAGKYQNEGLADLVVGNEYKSKIVDYLVSEEGLDLTHDRLGRFESVFYEGGIKSPKNTRSFLKIQDGCSQFCSFCIVPFARGLNRSVEPQKVLDSLYELAAKGVHEAVLTGIHLGTYGKDLNPKTDLLKLLKLIEEKKPIHRVRVSSIDPEELSDEMIEFFTDSQVFCGHLHLPLQSGDDEILRRMRRRYTAQYFEDLTNKIKKKNPDICLGTDVIVGFPGESEAQFENTYSLISNAPLSYLHVFPYSSREGTKANGFADTVSLALKKKRVARLRILSEEKRQLFYQSQIGRIEEVVVESYAKGNRGMTRNYIDVALEFVPFDARLTKVYLQGISNEEVCARPVLDTGDTLMSFSV
ncbi:MAG: hypothetical protein ACD_73C00655G0002 [uncultured bacterium]|nr:MAG: hypothetical protein ACD_73C00655G0002 [uncultured bacterium]